MDLQKKILFMKSGFYDPSNIFNFNSIYYDLFLWLIHRKKIACCLSALALYGKIDHKRFEKLPSLIVDYVNLYLQTLGNKQRIPLPKKLKLLLGIDVNKTVEIHPSKIVEEKIKSHIVNRKDIFNKYMENQFNNHKQYMLYPGDSSPGLDSVLKLKIYDEESKQYVTKLFLFQMKFYSSDIPAKTMKSFERNVNRILPHLPKLNVLYPNCIVLLVSTATKNALAQRQISFKINSKFIDDIAINFPIFKL